MLLFTVCSFVVINVTAPKVGRLANNPLAVGNLILLQDNRDIAVPLEVRELDPVDLRGLSMVAHRFVQVVLGEMGFAHALPVNLSILYEQSLTALEHHP